MPDLILHLGSNLGDRAAHLAEARVRLQMVIGTIYQASAIYRTAAWGRSEQPDFYNQALRLRTTLDPLTCLDHCRRIEDELGRTRELHWGPRTIDIDLLTYGHRIIDTEALQLPHPRLHERRFVLVPLHDLIPDWRHPILKKTVREMLSECPDTLAVQRIAAT